MTFNGSEVSRRPFHLKPVHAPGTEREMNEGAKMKVSSLSLLLLGFYNTHTHVSMIKH